MLSQEGTPSRGGELPGGRTGLAGEAALRCTAGLVSAPAATEMHSAAGTQAERRLMGHYTGNGSPNSRPWGSSLSIAGPRPSDPALLYPSAPTRPHAQLTLSPLKSVDLSPSQCSGGPTFALGIVPELTPLVGVAHGQLPPLPNTLCAADTQPARPPQLAAMRQHQAPAARRVKEHQRVAAAYRSRFGAAPPWPPSSPAGSPP